MEPIEKPSIKGDMPIFNIDFGHHFEHIFIYLFQPYHIVFEAVLGHNFIVLLASESRFLQGLGTRFCGQSIDIFQPPNLSIYSCIWYEFPNEELFVNA